MIRALYWLAVIVACGAASWAFFVLVDAALTCAHSFMDGRRVQRRIRRVLDHASRASLDLAVRIPNAKALRDAERRRIEREVGIHIADDDRITIVRH